MREIRTSGLMSGEGKRTAYAAPRSSSTLPVFLIYPDLGGFQMGPRYWFDGFVVMHIIIGSEFSQLSRTWQRFTVACCLLLDQMFA